MKHSKTLFSILLLITSYTHAGSLLPNEITVYKKPDCNCCDKWVDYLISKNYDVKTIETRDVNAVKIRLGVPESVAACHTAYIGGYVVEGHVTHRDIKRLLTLQPDVVGIAVPGMPVGTPGMERGDTKVPYNVLSFDKDGETEIFVEH